MFFKALVLVATALSAPLLPPSRDNQKIAFQNSILFKVRDKTVSMMDVKKKMDILFHQHYPDQESSTEARFAFYNASWQHVLSEMIDHELILSDAEQREIKITEGEVREALEDRFGPNVTLHLDQMNLPYSEAWQMVKNDLIVQRMMWWFVHSKALQKVTPQKIREAYRDYLKKNPSYQQLTYRVLTIRGKTPEKSTQKISQFLQGKNEEPAALLSLIQEIDPSVELSSEYVRKDLELSQIYKSILSALSPGEYSKPNFQMKKGQDAIGKIFYLVDKNSFAAPSFEEVAPQLKTEITNQIAAIVAKNYLAKLHEQFNFSENQLQSVLSSQNTPFSILSQP